MSEAEHQIGKDLGHHLFEGRRPGRGYHRERPRPLIPVSFWIDGHRFETEHRDLWVTLPGDDPVDRIKVSRSSVSRSAHAGYPPELVWPRIDRRIPREEIRAAAEFWLAWSRTADYRKFNPVRLDHWQRQVEMKRRSLASR